MSRGVRRWGLWSIVVARLALGAAAPGCGSTTPSGATGSHAGAGAGGGTSGAAGAAGTGSEAGTSGAAGDQAGTSGVAGGAGTGDASADVPATATDGGDVAGAAPDAACGPVRLDRIAPDLLLLLDRSGSMTNRLDGTMCPLGETCITRWNEVTKAVNQVATETEGSVRWGLKYFATNNSCAVSSGVAVPVGPMNATAIASSIASTQPSGQTPTRMAVASAGDYLRTLTDPNPKFLLLATDGSPNCAPNLSASTDDSAGAIMSVQLLADNGIPVYVIGIGMETSAIATLQQLATVGGRPRAGNPAYYPVESSADLVDALRAIGAQTMPCTYALPEVPSRPKDVVIKAANAVIPYDATHAEGWDFEAAMKSIHLYGTWCAKDQAGTLANIQESAPCVAGGPPD